MINAKEMRENADKNYMAKKNIAIKAVEEWMKKEEIEQIIQDASNQGLYEVCINTRKCPDTDTFNEILEQAGYSCNRLYYGDRLNIYWGNDDNDYSRRI